ncbi:MAG: glycosyltransferase family 2 protein [Microcystaceae cyanobacterium]
MDVPVSVIIPCYCCGATIKRTLESVAHQTYRPSEVLLVEDGSPDDTLTVLKSLEEQYPKNWLKIISLDQNQGVSNARNTGWDQATQPYIAFLDSDDIWHPRKIELQYQWLEEHPDVMGCGHHYEVVYDQNIQFSNLDAQFKSRLISTREILLSYPFQTSSLMMRQKLPYRFDRNRQYCEDYYLLINVILDKLSIAYLDISALFYDDLTIGLSANRWRMRVEQLKIYWQLWREGKTSLLMYLVSSSYSLTKFVSYLLLPKVHFWLKSTLMKYQ